MEVNGQLHALDPLFQGKLATAPVGLGDCVDPIATLDDTQNGKYLVPARNRTQAFGLRLKMLEALPLPCFEIPYWALKMA
jgi:hypothetical protein